MVRLRTMKSAFGAGSVPCKQQHTISPEIEIARSTLQTRTCPLLDVRVVFLAMAIFRP
jgi:hypothetical protein